VGTGWSSSKHQYISSAKPKTTSTPSGHILFLMVVGAVKFKDVGDSSQIIGGASDRPDGGFEGSHPTFCLRKRKERIQEGGEEREGGERKRQGKENRGRENRKTP